MRCVSSCLIANENSNVWIKSDSPYGVSDRPDGSLKMVPRNESKFPSASTINPITHLKVQTWGDVMEADYSRHYVRGGQGALPDFLASLVAGCSDDHYSASRWITFAWACFTSP